jgi:hypothetical protein
VRAETRILRAQIDLARGDEAAAISTLAAARDLKLGTQWEQLRQLLTGSALIIQGRGTEAARVLTGLGRALAFRVPPAYSDSISVAHILSLLEDCDEHGDIFRGFCERLEKEHPDSKAMLSHWQLRPSTPSSCPNHVFSDEFLDVPDRGWSWHDAFGDCRLAVDKGCTIAAPVGRGLRGSNFGAPRILRPARGRFAVQAVCLAADGHHRLAAGGLIAWMSPRDYLRLDVGSLSPRSVAFTGCVDNRDLVVGRGKLPAGQVWLRLERAGAEVGALCSPDGVRWQSVGEVSFPVDEQMDVGVFVDGLVRPELFPRAYAAGAEMRFTRVDLLQG